MTTTENASQHYNLKWTNHTNNIIQMFAEQLQGESLVDVTLSCEGKFLKAHKMVLSACSPYFQDLFQMHTVNHPLIIMHGVRFTILQQMIDFMYQGEIKVGDADLDSLLTIAETLQVKGLCKIRREKTEGEENEMPANPTPCSPASVNGVETKSRKRRKQSYSELNVETSSDMNTDESKQGTKDSDTESKSDTKHPKLLFSSKVIYQQSTNASGEDKTVDKQGSKIPRPPNAFMIFANEWRKNLAVQHQGESNKDISVRLGNMWKSLPATVKDVYYTAAKKADEDHKVKYPGYYYSPKEARLRKEQRGNSSQKLNVLPQTEESGTGLDSTSLVPLVEKNSENEEVNIEEAKEELESYFLYDNDSDATNESNISGENNTASTSSAKD